MAGVKLYHPTVRPDPGAQYAVYVVESLESYPVPYMCPLCDRAETRKSLHLRIGSDGTVIVSPEIYEKLQPVIATSGLQTQEVVENPPPLTVGAVELPKQEIIHRPLNADARYPNSYNPGRTKQESAGKLVIPQFKFLRRNP